MKLTQLFTRKKLRATTARRVLGAAEMDYEEMSEPNMKLSRALLIVLLLHVVAVSGIIAFNAIKTRQVNEVRASGNVSASSKTTEKPPAAPHASAATKEMTSSHLETKSAHPVAKASAREEKKTDHAKSAPAESGKTYVVAKGDTPLTISHKFKVPFDDLLAVNHIDDPHKLQVGQKLIIPAKPNKPKKID
jgi:LysM repeat protein